MLDNTRSFENYIIKRISTYIHRTNILLMQVYSIKTEEWKTLFTMDGFFIKN